MTRSPNGPPGRFSQNPPDLQEADRAAGSGVRNSAALLGLLSGVEDQESQEPVGGEVDDTRRGVSSSRPFSRTPPGRPDFVGFDLSPPSHTRATRRMGRPLCAGRRVLETGLFAKGVQEPPKSREDPLAMHHADPRTQGRPLLPFTIPTVTRRRPCLEPRHGEQEQGLQAG